MVSKSDIRIDSDGTWYFQGFEMLRRDIINLFYQNLRQDEAGGYRIEIGREQYPVEVEDTAFVVWDLCWNSGEHGAETHALLYLSDDTTEKLDLETLRIGTGFVPYCRVKDGRFEARFSRASYYKLTEQMQHDPDADTYCIDLNGRRYLL